MQSFHSWLWVQTLSRSKIKLAKYALFFQPSFQRSKTKKQNKNAKMPYDENDIPCFFETTNPNKIK